MVAMLDDRLDCSMLRYPDRVTRLKLEDGSIIPCAEPMSNRICFSEMTHATRCLRVFEKLNRESPVLHIEIIPSGNQSTDIHSLAQGLQYCLERQIEIICLSVGSTRLSDVMILQPILQNAKKGGSMVLAALDNRGVLTLPASLPQVIGVVEIYDEQLEQNLLRMPKNPWGIDLLVNRPLKRYDDIPLFENSFAVPTVAALAQNYCCSHATNPAEWTDSLPVFPLPNLSAVLCGRFSGSKISLPLTLYMQCEDGLNTEEQIQLANILAARHSIEAVFASSAPGDDIRIFFEELPLFFRPGEQPCLCADADIMFDLRFNHHSEESKNLPMNGNIAVTTKTVRLIVRDEMISVANDGNRLDAVAQAVNRLFAEGCA